ncbi:hypothetical protein VP06_25235 [Methylobacterium aquaticum]|uniref:Uncharacterized protein n=1 Tax=Methylobacterium aquaticum TaxID=270351 RepID=A0A0J6S651_9HYPH|nr:hypothetical protein VP06_25235 [Methylobacterium aquaticum]
MPCFPLSCFTMGGGAQDRLRGERTDWTIATRLVRIPAAVATASPGSGGSMASISRRRSLGSDETANTWEVSAG